MNKSRYDPLFDTYFWDKIMKAFLANIFTIPIVIIFLFVSGLVDEPFSKAVDNFQKSYSSFFWPLNRFFVFFRINGITTVIEEFIYRGPIRVLVGLIFFFRKELNWWFLSFIWSVGLFLNYQWATSHTTHELIWLPVFIAGLAWLWLVIRTNRLWPAIFCHAAANLSIYWLLKIYQYFI